MSFALRDVRSVYTGGLDLNEYLPLERNWLSVVCNMQHLSITRLRNNYCPHKLIWLLAARYGIRKQRKAY
jgi:hypothetical protein